MSRDPKISEIFYYFEKHTTVASGRTVGRKIGVVQEILCKKLLQTSLAVRDCIIYEPRLTGISGAHHKVEFVLFQPVCAIELAPGQEHELLPDLTVTVVKTHPAKRTAKIVLAGETEKGGTVKAGKLIKVSDYIPGNHQIIKTVSVTNDKVRFSVLDPHKPIASIESKRVGAQRFSGSEKLGSGIQTIEKAKQASLVAIDFDLRYNATLLAQTPVKENRLFKSFVVLGNGVHWTDNDLAILGTYVDYTYLATDKAIVRYADFVRNLATQKKADFLKFFMAYFKGTTKTPDDLFTVSPDDFVVVCPKGSVPLLTAVENQIKPYEVTTL